MGSKTRAFFGGKMQDVPPYVRWSTVWNRYRVYVQYHERERPLGLYNSVEDAINAYNVFNKLYNIDMGSDTPPPVPNKVEKETVEALRMA